MDNGRGTNDFVPGKRRRHGLLRELMERQGEVNDVIEDLSNGASDHVLVDGFDKEVIGALVLARIEMTSEPEREVVPLDIVWAGELIDHLDTQGFEVRRKSSGQTDD